jgi:hypothetical protein
MINCPIQTTVTGAQIILEVHCLNIGGPNASALVRFNVLSSSGLSILSGELDYSGPEKWAEFATNFNTWGWLFEQVKAHADIAAIPDSILESSIISPV